MKKRAIVSIIDNPGIKQVSRTTDRETRIAVYVDQLGGRLGLDLLVNVNGAITLGIQEGSKPDARTLISARVLVDRERVDGFATVELRKVNDDPLTRRGRTEAEGDPEYEAGFQRGFSEGAMIRTVNPQPVINANGRRWREGYRAGCWSIFVQHMSLLNRDIAAANIRDGDDLATFPLT